MLVRYWSLLLFFNLDMTHDWHVYFLHISGLNLIFIFSNEVVFLLLQHSIFFFQQIFFRAHFPPGRTLPRQEKENVNILMTQLLVSI